MGLAVIHTRALNGIKTIPVEVEVLTSNGLPGIAIVGLPEAAVRESKDRVRGAIKSSGFNLPQQRITINLAPADLPKEGGRYDLPIAIGILLASGQIKCPNIDQYEIIGELALGGKLRKIKGILPCAIAIKENHKTLIIPCQNEEEASLVSFSKTIVAATLLDVAAHLNQQTIINTLPNRPKNLSRTTDNNLDLSDIKGQEKAKRALEIAASGGHNILLVGPPGSGKTMLATRMLGIMPPLTEEESLETSTIYSVSQNDFDFQHWHKIPFRNPHHSASAVALVGGSSIPKPGEISLAHNGILFLDELPEFDRKVLEVLREPLESGSINISRANRSASFPANFTLVAACNPCKCGYYGDIPADRCTCSRQQIDNYFGKISGPLLDRIDIQIEVPRVPISKLQEKKPTGKNSQQIRQKVINARKIQLNRSNKINSKLSGNELEVVCKLDKPSRDLLQNAIEKLNLSARSYYRILRIARTIADLDAATKVTKTHVAEAVSYRIAAKKN